MFPYDNKRIIILFLVILAAIVTLPTGAFAAQGTAAPGAAAPGGQKMTMKQEYTYKDGESPNILQEIVQFGQVYTLVSVSEPVASETLPAKRVYTYQVSKNYTPEQLSQAPKDVKLNPVYGTGKRQVDRSETIKGLPDNDVDRLAPRKVYKDTNGRGPGARSGGELVLAEVKYEPTGWDEDGLPNKYTAHVVYRGEEKYRALLYYNAVATYTKTVSEDGARTYTVVATYECDATANDGVDGGAPGGSGGDGYGASGASSGVSDGSGSGGSGSGGTGAPTGAPNGDGLADGGGAGNASAAAGNGAAVLAGGGFRLPFIPWELSPLGIAAISTLIAAAVALTVLGIYNRRRLRESA